MRAAVVGHVEWIDFVRVPFVPKPGEIVHAIEHWEQPGGGGAVAAVQLAKLAAGCMFCTALADEPLGHRAQHEIRELGVDVRCVFVATSQRRGITFVDGNGERTITVLGDRLAPHADDDLPWGAFKDLDAVYVTAADAEAMKRIREARVVVATTRILPVLQEAGIELDAVVGSARDEAERYAHGDLDPIPRLAVMTEGVHGGSYWTDDGVPQRYEPAPVPGPIVDTYGAGDSFAAGLTFALGAGVAPATAVALAARVGAAVLTGRGPYQGQLRGDLLGAG